MTNCFLLSKVVNLLFSQDEVNLFYKNFHNNLNICDLGTVAAGTSSDSGQGGSYFYHWIRDASVSLSNLQFITEFEKYEHILKKYCEWVATMQNETDTNGIDIRGEPKFNLPDGELFEGAWARPQNDGAALSSQTLLIFAINLIENNQTDYVLKYLWNENGGIIKTQLNYVVNNYNSFTYDLWEEVSNSTFFFNLCVSRTALLLATIFAKRFYEIDLLKQYIDIIENIDKLLPTYFNGITFIESDNREYDSAVILGLNNIAISEYFGLPIPDYLLPSNFQIASTVNFLNELFTELFPINIQDTDNKVPGIMHGRYYGDTYEGGNPWVGTSTNLALLYYRASQHIKQFGLPCNDAVIMWLKSINSYEKNVDADTLSNLLLKAGDSILNRIYYHTKGNEGNLYEQINKSTGYMLSSENLTANYSSILITFLQRNQLVDTILPKTY
jgi:glucoamylase